MESRGASPTRRGSGLIGYVPASGRIDGSEEGESPKLKGMHSMGDDESLSMSDFGDNADGTTSPKEPADVFAQGIGRYLRTSLSELFLGSRMNVLMIALPLTVASEQYQWGKAWTFCLAIVALLPFGERISWVTEDFVKYTNETAGGLFLASVGNLTEIVFCINCLQGGLLRVVQVSMLGSVISNLLLVLGCAFLFGGLRFDEQAFNKVAAVTNSGLLVVAVLALCLPSILDATHTGNGGDTDISANETMWVNLTMVTKGDQQGSPMWLAGRAVLNEPGEGGAPLWLSRFIAIIMVGLYWMLIYFQFVTHTHLFQGEENDDSPGILGRTPGAIWMLIITYFIWILSDYVVNALEQAAKDMHVPVIFLSGVIVPVVGNAVEHASAVLFAMHNKMEISLGVAVGSAVQISIFVIPLTVLAGWSMGQPMSLDFHIFETVVLLLTCMSMAFVVSDGKSHWLKGAILVSAYLMISAAFYAHSEPGMI